MPTNIAINPTNTNQMVVSVGNLLDADNRSTDGGAWVNYGWPSCAFDESGSITWPFHQET
jgi:hypothetical protein